MSCIWLAQYETDRIKASNSCSNCRTIFLHLVLYTGTYLSMHPLSLPHPLFHHKPTGHYVMQKKKKGTWGRGNIRGSGNIRGRGHIRGRGNVFSTCTTSATCHCHGQTNGTPNGCTGFVECKVACDLAPKSDSTCS